MTIGVGLGVLACSNCLVFLWWFPLPATSNDAAEYLRLARNVAAGAGFSYDPGTPAVYRPPLFSLLLGGWFCITGTSSALSAAILQTLLHALAIVAAFGLFIELGVSLFWASAGGLFLAFNPLLVTRVALVLQEPTLMFVTTVATWTSVRWLRAPSLRGAASVGAAWGVCTLGKIVTWYVPFLILGMRLVMARSWSGRNAMEVVVLFLAFAAALAPWTVRNYLQFHRLIPVNEEFSTGILEMSIRQAVIPGAPPGEAFLAAVDRQDRSGRERTTAYWRYVREHLGYFAFTRVIDNAKYFAGPSFDWFTSDRPGGWKPHQFRAALWALSLVFHVPLYLAFFYRSWRWVIGREEAAVGFLIVLYWVYWAEYAVTLPGGRFNLPVYPLLIAVLLVPWRAARACSPR